MKWIGTPVRSAEERKWWGWIERRWQKERATETEIEIGSGGKKRKRGRMGEMKRSGLTSWSPRWGYSLLWRSGCCGLSSPRLYPLWTGPFSRTRCAPPGSWTIWKYTQTEIETLDTCKKQTNWIPQLFSLSRLLSKVMIGNRQERDRNLRKFFCTISKEIKVIRIKK